MRSALALLLVCVTGCGSTVYRLEGDPITPGGVAETPCESRDWLVLARTRAEVADEGKGTSHPVNGLGLYRVGSDSPESIPGVEHLPPSESVDKKRDEMAAYDRKQIVAGILGVAGVAAIAVGTALFVTSFETKKTRNPDGTLHEDNAINGTKAAAGGITVGVGFGLGIAGMFVNPNHSERTQARATRYVFIDPPDDAKTVEGMTKKHNDWVRQTCAVTR